MQKCRICLQQQIQTKSIYAEVQKDEGEDGRISKNLAAVIESISGVKITVEHEPLAAICGDCTDAILQAEVTIRKCRESDKRLEETDFKRKPRNNAKNKVEKKFESIESMDEKQEEIKEFMEIVELEEFEEKDDHFETNIDSESNGEIINEIRKTKNDKLNKISQQKRTTKQRGKRKSKNNGEEDNINIDKYEKEEHIRKLRTCRKGKIAEFDKADESHLEEMTASKGIPLTSAALHTAADQHNSTSSLNSAPTPRKYVRTVNKNKDYFFRCDQCAYTSHFATYFRVHMQQTHSIAQPRIFRCTQCTRDFLEYRYLQQHIAHDHQQQPRRLKYLCAECGRAFAKSSNLAYHQRTHLPREQREVTPQVACEYCAKAFSRHSLRMHVLTVHAAARPHACARCQAAFAVAKSLQAHMRTCHPAEVHRCPCCDVQFRVRSVYEAHVQRGGCRKLDFNCDYCAWGFKTRERLEKHRRNVHKQLLLQQQQDTETGGGGGGANIGVFGAVK